MEMAELPIIVLAFANEQEGRRYLRDLPEELRRLQDILKDAERNGLCRLELLPNATLDQIFDVFTRNRDQVTILHYAGHADSGRLLLESSAAGGAPAHATGLATFLGQCGGLQLVFLNGCSTRAQVARLLEAGVAAVIATARAIDDGMARAFAVAFYTELASGLPLRAAYEKARGRVLAAHDTVPEAYYGHRDFGTTSESASPDPTDDHGFPWEFRPGTELVERWSLPDAAGNPEFGLPRLPDRDLPETPFRHLNWFTAEHAEVFFGRGYQVRELYEEVIDPAGPPILLLYGASGVGKSSLLDAGLVPRLEAGGRAVRYRRRDEKKGLLGSLRDAFQLTVEPTALGEAWRAEEARLGKPLVIFLDQVEEVFTRPDPAQPGELDEFLTGLVAALGNRETRPQGKLVLGFRKEWLAELDRRLAEAKLPRTPVFLKPLDRRGIIGAIRGPARPGRLQRQYRLAIEDGLPEVIADNLLADAGSALSSTLQVLLTKMWERARQTNPDQPRFDRVLYESLKAEGYLLKDVLDEGLKAIGRWKPAVEDSGLALDVLVYHTTDLGTAAQCTRAELTARYAHQVGALDGLLGQCKDHYLIVEAEASPGSTTRSTRLAHDLLAPLVQQRFRLSVAPGQRARRLLENRAPEWRDGKNGAVLDSNDLSTVEEGAAGMRVWNADEIRLVEASRHSEEQQKAEEAERVRRLHEAEEGKRQAEIEKQKETEQRLKEQEESNQRLRKRAYALGGILALTVGVALLAANRWLAADKATQIARDQTRLAEDRLKIATSRQLAALSTSERNNRLDRSLLLAVEALHATDPDQPTFEARSALLEALQYRPGLISFMRFEKGDVRSVAFSPDGKTIAACCNSFGVGKVMLWDTAGRKRPTELPLAVKEVGVQSVAFSPDGKTIAAGYGAGSVGGVVLWDVAGRKRPVEEPLAVSEGSVWSVAFSPDGKTIAAGYGNVNGAVGVVLWDAASRGRLAEEPLTVKEGNVSDVAFSPDGKTIAAGYGNVNGFGGGVVLWDTAGRKRPTDLPLAVKEGIVESVAFSPDGKTIAAGYGAGSVGGVVLWDVAGRKRTVEEPLAVSEGSVRSVMFSPDGKTIVAGYSDIGGIGFGGVVLWNAAGRKRQTEQPLAVKEGSVRCVAFSADGKTIASGYGNVNGVGGGVALWDAASRGRLEEEPLNVKEGNVSTVAFSPDGTTIAAGYGNVNGAGGGVVLWDTAGRKRTVEEPLAVKEGIVESVAFSPDGRTIAAGYGAGHVSGVVQWDVADRTRRTKQPLAVKEGSVRSVMFSPDGKTIATGYDYFGGGVVLLNATGLSRPAGEPLALPSGDVLSVAYSPDGKTIAVGYRITNVIGEVVLWDVADRTRRTVERLNGRLEGGVSSVAFSPDGKTIAAGYGGVGIGGLVLWDAASRGRLAEEPLAVKEGNVSTVAFSPDGKTIAAGYDAGSLGGVVFWDVKGRVRLAEEPLVVKDGKVSSVAFSPDGKTIAAGYRDKSGGGVMMWDVDLESWQRIAGRIADRNFTGDEWRQYFPQEPYRRTFRELPWPSDLSEAERSQAEQKEQELPPSERCPRDE